MELEYNTVLDKDVNKACQDKFIWIATELALRENNNHVGTGLGGNNFQLLGLLNVKHRLSSYFNDLHYYSHDNTLYWNYLWLRDTDKISIRNKLNETFSSVEEHFKYEALAFQALSKSDNLRSTLNEYKDQFPQLISCLSGGIARFDPDLSNSDKLILAFVLCQELAADLDNNILDKIQTVGYILLNFPPEITLFSIRRFIQIDRIVKHNLDEDVVFKLCIQKINDIFT